MCIDYRELNKITIKKAPEPQGRIYAYTKGDVQAGLSTVVTGQLPFA